MVFDQLELAKDVATTVLSTSGLLVTLLLGFVLLGGSRKELVVNPNLLILVCGLFLLTTAIGAVALSLILSQRNPLKMVMYLVIIQVDIFVAALFLIFFSIAFA
jgi:hypothetical protein